MIKHATKGACRHRFILCTEFVHKMGPVRIRHSSHDFATQSSHSVDLAGWQAKMASIEILDTISLLRWIP